MARMTLAVQDWRIDFSVDGRNHRCAGTALGLPAIAAQQPGGAAAPLELHREFRARFG